LKREFINGPNLTFFTFLKGLYQRPYLNETLYLATSLLTQKYCKLLTDRWIVNYITCLVEISSVSSLCLSDTEKSGL
jgi:hypothetical protein